MAGCAPEYDFAAMKGGVRAKYLKRLRERTNIVALKILYRHQCAVHGSEFFTLSLACTRKPHSRSAMRLDARARTQTSWPFFASKPL
jgi:hypothetical protein